MPAAIASKVRERQMAALAVAMREFEGRDVPQIAKRIAGDESRYRKYVSASLALEEEMRDSRSALRDRIPRAEQQVSILERAGITQFEGCATRSNGKRPLRTVLRSTLAFAMMEKTCLPS
jgi:hypothetical protein